jgi:AbiV family abortive infection protein
MKQKASNSPTLDTQLLHGLASKALTNVRGLVEDAEILFERSRWPRCLFLAQIASEEVGKAQMIAYAVCSALVGKLDAAKFWSRYKSHKSKLTIITSREIELLSEDVDEDLQHLGDNARACEQAKLLALYSDLLEGSPISPAEVIHEVSARASLVIARGRLELAEKTIVPVLSHMAAVPERALRSWAECLDAEMSDLGGKNLTEADLKNWLLDLLSRSSWPS